MHEKTSYHRLITEHDSIEAAASQIVAQLDSTETLDATLHVSLAALSTLVKHHIECEEDILTHLDQKHLNGSWVQAWMAAARDFDELKADWLAFLAEWDLAAIESRRAAFAAQARSMLGRLNTRVHFETSIFYAAALQSGAIRLR